MKSTYFVIAAMVLCTLAIVSSNSDRSAQAAAFGQAPFSLYSGASGTTRTSSAINVRGFATKSIIIEGVTPTSNPGSITFKSMSGTAIVQCSNDNTVWETCIANDYAQTAISRTTNGIFTWRDAFAYVRFKWTSGAGKLKAWLTYQEN